MIWSRLLGVAAGAHDFQSAGSRHLKPCSRPRRSSKKVMIVCSASSVCAP
jgi:hypothetical protein